MDYHGVQDEINISNSGKIINAKLNVDIQHSWRGDLKVILVTPGQDETMLHNREGRSFNNIKKPTSFAEF